MKTLLQGILLTAVFLLAFTVFGLLSQLTIFKVLSMAVVPVIVFMLVYLTFTKPEKE